MASLTVSSDILDALVAHFDKKLSTEQVGQYLNAAVRDLRGSVSAESLPEMAIRLAVVRMDQATRARSRAGQSDATPASVRTAALPAMGVR